MSFSSGEREVQQAAQEVGNPLGQQKADYPTAL
jgi:hypothetical protein